MLGDIDAPGIGVARISAVRSRRDGDRRLVEFAAVGFSSTCDGVDPEATPWQTDFVNLVVEFTRRVPVFFAGTDDRARRRPNWVAIGASQQIYALRWSRWGGQQARAHGVFPANDCVPSCAEGSITPRPVRVTLSQPRRCGARYRYLVLRYRFLDSRGGGGRTTFGYQC